MKRELFNDDWLFWVEKDAFLLDTEPPATARRVRLPHDEMIEEKPYAESPNQGNTGFRDGVTCVYMKEFTPKQAGTFLLEFDGVYSRTMVFVNGQFAGKRPYGYARFRVDLTPLLHIGKPNVIKVKAHNGAMPNSRWYSGSGIYRDVHLLFAPDVFVKPGSLRVTTESIDEQGATVGLQASVVNHEKDSRSLTIRWTVTDLDGQLIATEAKPISVAAHGDAVVNERFRIPNVNLWSAETPYLYRATLKLEENDDPIDKDETRFGVRTISVDAVQGFRVNGQTVKLRGACIHHDHGILGAATFYDAEYRRVRRLKEAGFNALRMSHHPCAEVLLQACDELGVYVMDETFDMWHHAKTAQDYSLEFNEWWRLDVEAMVERAYNHPSVAIYSIGNEITEIGTAQGVRLEGEIYNYIKALDSTRPITAGVNIGFALGADLPKVLSALTGQAANTFKGNVNNLMTSMNRYWDKIVVHELADKALDNALSSLDVAGYNYATARYEKDAKDHPNRVIVGSETYPPEIARNWEIIERLPAVIGDFTWTGWDYIGEAGVGIPTYRFGEGGFGAQFPCQLAYVGDHDITGFRRPLSYCREIAFGLRRDPYIAVQPPEHFGHSPTLTPWVLSDASASWNHSGFEGKPIIVEVYGKGDEVELLVNGSSCGRKPVGEEHRLVTRFETIFEPGSLEAILYANGIEVGRSKLCSAVGEPRLQANVEPGNTAELFFVALSLEDAHGEVFTDRFDELTVVVEGAREWRLGSGDPKPVYNYTESITNLWQGRAQLIVRKTSPTDHVAVTVSALDQTLELTL